MYFSPLRVLVLWRSSSPPIREELRLRVGDWVEVRPLDEIMSTLEAQGSLDAMPFMPEMAGFCGQRFQVFKVAHKTCDTAYSFVGRSVERAVHLAGLRCDGDSHGGCQAGCLLFWKEAWLRRVDGPRDLTIDGKREPVQAAAFDEAVAELARQARCEDAPIGEARYRCQATELLKATKSLSAFDLRHHLRDLTSGNLSWWTLLRGIGVSVSVKLERLRTMWRFRHAKPRCVAVIEPLNLKPGDLVQVRSKAEIMATLEDGVRNRGLSFDAEMERYCGRTMRVLRRVDRILDEKTGRMLRLRKDCIILEGVMCSGLRAGIRRLGCSKSVYSFWREAWLRRVEFDQSERTEGGEALTVCGGCTEGEPEPGA
jgi:hypothetical protein